MSDTSGSTTPSATGTTGAALTYAQVESYWIQAGGNPQAAAMAAAVADASSGLDPSITRTNPDGTTSVGLWLIPQNGTPPGSTDPLANARAAVQMSNNGTNWQTWCTTWSDNDCGCNGGTYLGDGANALGALGQTGAYNVIGSSPTGTGTSASSVGSTTSTPTSSSSYVKWLVIAALLLAVFFMVRHQKSGGGESEGRSQASWSPAEEAELSSGKSDKEISQDLGRSVRAIRVRRNQLKG